MKRCLTFGERVIGAGSPVYIIAEMSANHNQNFETAVALIRAAKDAGADAIKLQTYTPDTLTIDCDNEYFHIKKTLWDGQNLYDLYSQASTPWEWHAKLQHIAKEIGLDFFSTPFDDTAVDFLEDIGVPLYKVASFELVDHGLLKKIGSTSKPVIMSTGMATLEEIEEAVMVLQQSGTNQLALLKCTSAYPALPEDMDLQTIPHLAETFALPIGLSDHSMEVVVPVAAVALGATIIEKHLTLSRDTVGADSGFSLEPKEFAEMVKAVRATEKSIGTAQYGLSKNEQHSRVFRRSLFVVQDMEKGDVFTKENVRSIRPCYGLEPKFYDEVLGCESVTSVLRGTPLSWGMVG